jgi:hypothetical protein
VLHVFGVSPQLTDDVVVVAVCRIAEGLLSLDDDHDRAVGVEFFEVVTQPHHRLHGRRVHWGHWCGVFFADHFQARHDDIHQDGNEHPANNDRHREQPNCMWEVGPMGPFAAHMGHADFTRQNVWALTPLAVCSSRTTPSTVTRQRIWSLSPCTMMLALTAGRVVLIVCDHGSGTAST